MSGHRPRKRFGQHFLHDALVLGQISAALNLQSGDRLFEIGPGRGALTAELYDPQLRYRAIEIDRDLTAALQAQYDQLELIEGDVLRVELATLLAEGSWRVVGNLPYNITSPLLGRLFAVLPLIQDVHVMLQKEVALRLGAEPGSKAYGRLSIACQVRMEIEFLLAVAPESFTPPPAVQSAVVRLVPKPASEQLQEPVLEALDYVLRLAFQQRRKRLSNALRSLPIEDLSRLVDPGQRADQISVSDYVALARAVAQNQS